ncbi:hypothetical protein ONE63_010304 [Megalurothrips usitatus]|uniref:Uncharacterized protein n=1 Tax=Megalurothrips usitatus TaxID=439358 RepID=A0AAV7XHE6_9NEOP|nr:hypothetical protein ONE63_010304 [Megalurothrips usitatus]
MWHVCTDRRRHPAERVLWAALVVLAWYGAFSVSVSRWRRYQDTPTVTSLERDYMAWNTTFPAITVCPTGGPGSRVRPELADEEAQRLAREFRVQNESLLREFVERLSDASLYTLPDIPNVSAIPGDRFLGIIERVTAPWNFAVVASLASDMATATYKPDLVPTLTELGMCYSFNSLVAAYMSPRYWRLGAAGVADGRGHGLLEVNPMDGSVFAQLSGLPGAYQLFVHGPEEVPDLQSPFLTSPEGQFKRLEVSALAVHTAPAARWLRPEHRRCRFMDEPLEPGAGAPRLAAPVYSYALCRKACRAGVALRACECVPHLYGPMCKQRLLTGW